MYEGRTQSLSEEAKVALRKYVEEGREYARGELVAAIRDNTERSGQMTDGVVAGVIKMLSASGELVPVARGRYRLGHPQDAQDFKVRVTGLYDRFRFDLDKACRVNVLNLTECDIAFIKKVTEITAGLETAVMELEAIRGADEVAAAEGQAVEIAAAAEPPVDMAPAEEAGPTESEPRAADEPVAEADPVETEQQATGSETPPVKEKRKAKKGRQGQTEIETAV